MVAVRMMQTAVNQIIDVIAMRHRLVAAARPVDMRRFVASAARGALIRVGRVDLDLVLIHMIAMRMVQMAIVKVIDMAAVLDGRVSAARTMLMVMVSMRRFVARGHACLL